jgi:hypothetical protein
MRAPDGAGEREYISFLFKGGLGMIFDSTFSLKEIRRLNKNLQPPEMQEWSGLSHD